MIRIPSLLAALLVACLGVLTPLQSKADDTIEFARQRMRCDAWLEIHHNGGKDAKTIEDWSVGYLKQVAHDFAVDMARKDSDRVRETAEKLLSVRPESQTALEGLAASAFSSGDNEAAARFCAKLVETTPDHFEGWFNLGVAQQRRGKFEEAARAYSEAFRVRPDSAQAYVNLGIVRQEMGEFAEARKAYERALQLDASQTPALWNLALVLEQLGEPDGAEGVYVKLLEATPDCDEARFRLGFLQLQRGDFKASASAFEICLKKRSEWPEAQLNVGIAYWKQGLREEARTAFEAVLATQPNSADALRGLAALALEADDYQKALDLHGKLIELGERTPELLYNTALLLQQAGVNDEAVRLYREAVKVQPTFAEAFLNLGPTWRRFSAALSLMSMLCAWNTTPI